MGTRDRSRRRTGVIPRLWLCAALAAVLPVPALVSAAELEDLYPGATPQAEFVPAREAVSKAFENLFGLSSMMSVVHQRTAADGNTTRARFTVLRRQTEDSWRILTENLAPEDIEGMRLLQIDR